MTRLLSQVADAVTTTTSSFKCWCEIWGFCFKPNGGLYPKLVLSYLWLIFISLQQVLNPRSALLSNFEVLTLLRELESDHLARAKTALRIKEEDQAAGGPNKLQPIMEEVPENLRTIEVEVRQLLVPVYHTPSYVAIGDTISNGRVPAYCFPIRIRSNSAGQRTRFLRFDEGRKTTDRQSGSDRGG
jgi:hypothetical protein